MARVISTAIQFIDGFTNPSKQVIKNMVSMGREAEKAGKQIQNAGKFIESAGSALTGAITMPVVGVAAAAVKTAADFEASMSQVAATMGKTKDDVKGLSELAQQMGATTSFSAIEAAEGINILAMAGLDAAQIGDSLGTVLDLAAAGNIEMGDAASYVAGAVKGFGDEMKNSSKYADLMAKGATLANTDVALLGEAVSYGAATARSYGQTADGMTLSLLRLAEQNVTGQTAATGLNRVMTDLYAPADAAQKALKSLGVSAYNADGSAKDLNVVVDELSSAFSGMTDENVNALKSIIFTSNGMQTFDKMAASTTESVKRLQEGLQGAGGSASQQAQTQLDNLKGQMTLLKSAIEGVAITIGNKLLPHISKVVEWAQKAFEWINNLSDAQVDSIMKWAGIAAAVGPAVMAFGKAVQAIGTAQRTFGAVQRTIGQFGGIFKTITSPAGIAIMAVAAVAAAAFLIIRNWDKVKAFLQRARGWFAEAFGRMGITSEGFKAKFEAVRDAVLGIADKIGAFIGPKLEAAKNAVGAVAGKIGGFIKDIGRFDFSSIKALFGRMGAAVSDAFAKCGVDMNKFKENMANIRARAGSIMNNLKTVFTVAFGAVRGAAAKAVPVFGAIIGAAKAVAGVLGPVFKVAFKAVTGAVAAAVSSIAGIISGIMTVFDGITSFLAGVFTGNWRKAWDGIKTVFKGVFESLSALCRQPINAVIGIINGAIAGINSLGLTIPEWVPGIGGQSFSINVPTIPMLYRGTDSWKGGLAMINDRGGEIVDLPEGSRVYPHDRSVEMARKEGGGGTVNITIQKLADRMEVRSDGDIDRIAEALAYRLKNIAFNTGTA